MTLMLDPPAHAKRRAPREHGQAIIEPPLTQAGELLAENAATVASYTGEIAGVSLAELAELARRELVERATNYVRQYRNVPPLSCERLIVAGHQPQMFHPGVWLKNFALDRLARQLEATAVNLLIDNDLVRYAAVNAPAGSVQQPRQVQVVFDEASAAVPYEERQILDRDLWTSFGGRLREQVEPFVSHPLIEEYWPRAIAASLSQSNLGRALAEARHQLEGAWGLKTLELPLSHMAESESFELFAAHLLLEAPRFAEIHNQALAEYRQAHRIRNGAHPVSDLAVQGGWIEAPLWVWSQADPRRRRLFVRQVGEALELTDREGFTQRIPLQPGATAGKLLAAGLADLRKEGMKFRPRALITTMFARLLAGDLFLHGIGGAKYDELTDRIIGQFFDLRPPAYVTLTATALLPLSLPDVAEEDLRRVDGQLRELRYHPEKFAKDQLSSFPLQGDKQQVSQLIAEKAQWVARELPRGSRRPRHQAISEINKSLQPYVDPLREQLQNERAFLDKELSRRQVLASREYPFCIYPAQPLAKTLLAILSDTP